jgi:hypothetical protein
MGCTQVQPNARAGWSRSAIPVTSGMRVLDLGSGAFPNPRADVLCDRELIDSRHRAGLPIVVDRPTVVADAGALPFRDGAFDFAIASHLAEHLLDPASFCKELSRVARAGYIETPSPVADVLLHEEYHLWRVSSANGELRFLRKGERSALQARLTDPFYFVLNAGQPSCERSTMGLPRGVAGRILTQLLRVATGTLARLGLLHTRHRFSPTEPLRFRIDH